MGYQSISWRRAPVAKFQNLILPSSEQEMTVLLRLSMARPVTAPLCLPSPFANVFGASVSKPVDSSSCSWCSLYLFASAGVRRAGNLRRCCPDCRLYMSMEPPADPIRAKVPQGEMATLLTSVPSPVSNAQRPALLRPQNQVLAVLSP